MQIVLVKYIQLFCMTLSFTNRVNCDKLFLHSEIDDKQIYSKASCTAECLRNFQNLTLNDCFENCRKTDNINLLKNIYENIDIRFLCRDDSTLAFKILHKNFNNYKILDKSLPLEQIEQEQYNYESTDDFIDNSNRMYVIKVHKAENSTEQQRLLTNSTIIKIENLLSNTIYNISAAFVNSNYEYSLIADNIQHKTLYKKYLPKKVSNISLLRYIDDDLNNQLLKGIITWKPAKDMTCHYDILCYPSQDKGFLDFTAVEIRDLTHLYTYTIESFAFGTEYIIGIRSKNTKDSSKESELEYITVTTPTCLEWHLYDLNICPPMEPKNLKALEIPLSLNEYSINITWDKTIIDPEYYSIKILDLNLKTESDPYSMSFNVSKDQNSAYIPSIPIKGHAYEVYVIAHSLGGNAASVTSVSLKNLHITEKNHLYKLISAIVVLIIVIVILIAFIISHRRGKLKRYNDRCKYFEDLDKKTPNSNLEMSLKNFPTSTERLQQILEDKLYFNDNMEINRNNLELYDEDDKPLGEGEFGIVRRGVLLTDDNTYLQVAVKMLKDHPSIENIKGFRREIDTMKSVGKHQHIVGIIGHYTKNINEMLLLTEYCSRGNLLNFMRSTISNIPPIELNDNKKPIDIDYIDDDNNTIDDSENSFNFDTSFVDKISLKYKNISKSIENNISLPNIFINNSYGMNDEFKTNNLSINNDEIDIIKNNDKLIECTNFCKCQVNIINNNKSINYNSSSNECLNKNNSIIKNNKKNLLKLNNIEITNCKCNLNQIYSNNKNDIDINNKKLFKQINNGIQLCVENKGYFKIIDTTNTNLKKNLTSESLIDKNNSIEIKSNASKVNSTTTVTTTTNISDNNKKYKRLSSTELLNIAKQVALGMEFLSKCKVVHRDLAARNVLVCSDYSIKIADFGLSRDIYQENIYKKTGDGKLPIKWLALESLTHSIYTTQSDVWSYGILLYEIVTLGETPYQAISKSRLVDKLKSGYRMERPTHCSKQLYNLMKSCWNASASERPTFSDISHILDDLIKSDKNHIENLQQFCTSDNDISCNSDSDDAYLKPIE